MQRWKFTHCVDDQRKQLADFSLKLEGLRCRHGCEFGIRSLVQRLAPMQYRKSNIMLMVK